MTFFREQLVDMGPVADDVCVFSRQLWLRLTALAGLRLVESGPSSLWYQRCGAPPEAAMWIPAEAPGLCASVCLYGPMDGGVCPPCRPGFYCLPYQTVP